MSKTPKPLKISNIDDNATKIPDGYVSRTFLFSQSYLNSEIVKPSHKVITNVINFYHHKLCRISQILTSNLECNAFTTIFAHDDVITIIKVAVAVVCDKKKWGLFLRIKSYKKTA